MNTSRRNARGEATLRAILAETASLVSRYGYAGTTISRITKATGKPASSLYWFFPTKDELVAAALEGTYQGTVQNLSAWPGFDPHQDMHEQLIRILTPTFTSSESEGSVRLGLMVVLEGSSEGALAREPFRLRRQKVREQIRSWWSGASAAHAAANYDEVAETMVELTIAFIDGHYISDIKVDPARQTHRGELVANALYSVFRKLLASDASPRLTAKSKFRSGVSARSSDPETRDILLKSACALVAERGYEGATLALIGERASMQRSSIYWRYKGKEELIRDAVAEPFLRLVRTATPMTVASGHSPRSKMAKSISNCAAASMQDPDTVKAGLLLKLQRRDPLSLGSEAIQRGLADQESAMTSWIATAADANTAVDPAVLTWMVSVFREGLMLGVAFGYDYNLELLENVCSSMIDGVLDGLAPVESH